MLKTNSPAELRRMCFLSNLAWHLENFYLPCSMTSYQTGKTGPQHAKASNRMCHQSFSVEASLLNETTLDPKIKTVCVYRSGVFNLSTIEIWGHIILCCKDLLPALYRTSSSILSFYPLEASSVIPVVTSKNVQTWPFSSGKGKITLDGEPPS